jgi:sulfate/thiosulfate transport system substrate-binding protein
MLLTPRPIHLLFALVAPAFLLAASACGGSSASSQGNKLTLVAYSTPREAYEELTKEFGQTPAGEGVTFDQSYGSSGEQSRAVESGLGADVVAFSLAPDMERLVEADLVDAGWSRAEYDGMITTSVVVFAVRKGNPKGITTWDDLIEDGVEVITPNPFTSGGARWNVMAAYGAQQRLGKTHEQAVEYLDELFKHVSVQDKSARESLQTFTGGKGDVLIAYENEAITAQQKGEELDYVIPDQTILIENPIAVTKDSSAKATAFLEFLRSEQAQKVFAEKGYRSVIPSLLDSATYPQPQVLFSIDSLGGWDKVQETFFDREDGIMAGIQRNVGAALE